MVWFLALITLSGFNFSFWCFMGVLRYTYETYIQRKPVNLKRTPENRISIFQVAAIIPAHNEEQSIARTIAALKRILPKENIHVASDNSTDRTVEIAKRMGVKVSDIRPNKGKAKALVHVMQEYNLLDRYKAILINDADVEIDQNYMNRGLQLFDDPDVAALAPHENTRLKDYSPWELFFIMYRIRLWRILHWGMRYGMSWRYANASYIIPGSLCTYRTSVLKKIEIDAPNLVIEDFNMTFEVHRKKLGRIAYVPSAFGIAQDPYNFRDYVKQIKRWNLGFWQTIIRNGVWPSLFWLTTGAFIIEIILYNVFMLFLPDILLYYVLNNFQPLSFPFIGSRLTFSDCLIGIFMMDYVLTVIAAFFEKKPIMLLYGLAFIFIRYIDAFIYMYSIPRAFLVKSSGVWTSPTRK